MQEVVDIGGGRGARRVYGLDDIAIVPARRTRSSHDVDVTWKIDAYECALPLMNSATDALATPEFIVELGRLGGLPVVNAEGLWGRVEDLDAALTRIKEAAAQSPIFDSHSEANKVLQELHALPLNMDLFQERMDAIRESGVTFGVRVSPQNARRIAPDIISKGADLLVIQGTLVSAEHVLSNGEPLNLKEFIGSLDIPVIAGGVVNYTTAMHLMRSGAAGVIVGAGASTNDWSLGIDVPMATAIADAAAARRDYLDETGGRYVHVIADSDLQSSGDLAKALACGADAVSLGSPLAAAQESAGRGWYWTSTAAHPQLPRGTVEQICQEEELLPLERILRGPSTNPYGVENLIGGLKRSMAKCGYTDIKSFQKVDLVVR